VNKVFSNNYAFFVSFFNGTSGHRFDWPPKLWNSGTFFYWPFYPHAKLLGNSDAQHRSTKQTR